MRLIVADCSAIYTGRGDTTLPRGPRAILIKSDGSVSIHNENSNKPLNYMKTANQTLAVNEHGEQVWSFDARHESLTITLHRVLSEFEEQLLTKEDEPGLLRDGTEAHLQQWIFDHPEVLGEGYQCLQREFETGAGPVDILAISPEGVPMAVEVKRVATPGAADQVRRYAEAMRAIPLDTVINKETGEPFPFRVDFSLSEGLIAAADLRPKLMELAAKRQLATVLIPKYWRTNDETDVDTPEVLETN